MPDVAAAPKPARNMKPMPMAEPVIKPLPQSTVPPTPMREAVKPKLLDRNFSVAGHTGVVFEAVISADWDFEDVLDPAFWVNVAPRLVKNPFTQDKDYTGSKIELRTIDHAFYADLMITKVSKDGLVVKCLGPGIDIATGKRCPIDLQTEGPWAGRKYAVAWNKELRGYDVIRKADGVVVADGSQFLTAEKAIEWASAEAKKAA